MTQDIGTAIQRHDDFGFSNMAYTVGNEQDYHFKVLFLILDLRISELFKYKLESIN